MGLPDHAEATEALLTYKLQAAHGDVRSFLSSTVEGEDLGEFSGVIADVEQVPATSPSDGSPSCDCVMAAGRGLLWVTTESSRGIHLLCKA